MEEEYKDRIIEIIINIEDVGMLKYIHKFISLITEKWGK